MKQPENLRISRQSESFAIDAGPTWREYAIASWMVACSTPFVVGGVFLLIEGAHLSPVSPATFHVLAATLVSLCIRAVAIGCCAMGLLGIVGGLQSLCCQSLTLAGGELEHRKTALTKVIRRRTLRLSGVCGVGRRMSKGKAGTFVSHLVAIDGSGAEHTVWEEPRLNLLPIVVRLFANARIAHLSPIEATFDAATRAPPPAKIAAHSPPFKWSPLILLPFGFAFGGFGAQVLLTVVLALGSSPWWVLLLVALIGLGHLAIALAMFAGILTAIRPAEYEVTSDAIHRVHRLAGRHIRTRKLRREHLTAIRVQPEPRAGDNVAQLQLIRTNAGPHTLLTGDQAWITAEARWLSYHWSIELETSSAA